MRRVAVALAVLVVALAGVAAVVAILNARDDATVDRSVGGPGVERIVGARPVVAPGNVVLLFSDERQTTALRELARDTGGPATAAVRAAGQAVIVQRRPGLRVPVVALTRDRRLDAGGADDPRLRPFVEYWLGRRASG